MTSSASSDAGVSSALAERLREETRVLHARAERAGIMPGLLRGSLDLSGYASLLRNLVEIYRALEDALTRQSSRPDVAPVVMARLFRSAALADDLQALHGADWAQALRPAPATVAYLQRLGEIEARAPHRLVAHAYVRYLGDLSGGQILRRVVSRAYHLAEPAGVRFYDFGSERQVRRLADEFRRRLGQIACSPIAADEIVDEAKLAFSLHVRLFEELAA